MRIVICGTQCNGKSTLIAHFKSIWPKYESPTRTYRDIIKEKNLTINQDSTCDSQLAIREALIDQMQEMSDKSHVVYDRSILDNIVYTLHGVEKGRIKDEKFVADSITICREMMKMVDIIFWLPLNNDIEITDQPNRDVDPIFREEIDHIFHAIYESYVDHNDIIFDIKDQPAMILLEGDIQDKLDIISQYLNDDGDLIETTDSVLSSLEEEYDKIDLMNKIR